MGFELWIQRYIEEKPSAEPVAGLDISELEFHGLMQDPGCTNLPGTNTYRLMHESGVPWLVADLETPLEKPWRIRLSISYANFRFARAWTDAFDAGLEMAKQLNAHLIEGKNNSEVTAENIDALLNPEGEYVQAQLQSWQDTLNDMNAHNRAPLEYPLGHIDSVREYFCLSVRPEVELNAEKVSEEMGYALRLRGDSTTAGAICDANTKRPKTKIIFREDGKVQLQPFYWKESFTKAAAETLEIAEAIREKYGGELFFFTEPVTDELKDTLKLHINALGIDFYWWVGDFFKKRHAN